MKATIKEIKSRQIKLLALLEELRHARKLEKIKASHEVYYILKGGYLWRIQQGRWEFVLATSEGEIKNYLATRKAIARGQVLDLDNRLKKVYKHKAHGKI